MSTIEVAVTKLTGARFEFKAHADETRLDFHRKVCKAFSLHPSQLKLLEDATPWQPSDEAIAEPSELTAVIGEINPEVEVTTRNLVKFFNRNYAARSRRRDSTCTSKTIFVSRRVRTSKGHRKRSIRRSHAYHRGRRLPAIPASNVCRRLTWGGPRMTAEIRGLAGFPTVKSVVVSENRPVGRQWSRRNGHSHEHLLREGLIDCSRQGLLDLAIKGSQIHHVVNMVDLILRHGADVNELGSRYQPPLHTACMNGYGHVAQLLLEHKADPLLRQTQGFTALDAAVRYFGRVQAADLRPSSEFALASVCATLQRALKAPHPLTESPTLLEVRRHLSATATELALLKAPSSLLTKLAVVEKSGISSELLEDFGEELWNGWPTAFLTFREEHITSTPSTFDPSFVNVRLRIVKSMLMPSLAVDSSTSLSWWNRCHWCCSGCWRCESTPTDAGMTCEKDYEDHKLQNKKWKRHNQRQTRRTAYVAMARRNVSFSAKMARKLARDSCFHSAQHGHKASALERYEMLDVLLDFN